MNIESRDIHVERDRRRRGECMVVVVVGEAVIDVIDGRWGEGRVTLVDPLGEGFGEGSVRGYGVRGDDLAC